MIRGTRIIEGQEAIQMNIEIVMDYPKSIHAIDETNNQSIFITRNKGEHPTDDEALCTIMSCLIGDEEPQKGTCLWVDAFLVIQRMFGGTAL